MKFGFFADRELPEGNYRCPSWDPMPAGKKNVVVLGCSHTYGEGLDDDQHWVYFLSKHNADKLRYWNLAQPGASADKIVRILYGCEKLIDPKIIIVLFFATEAKKEVMKDFSVSFTLISFSLENSFNKQGKSKKVTNKETMSPKVIIHPKSMIGLIPLNIKDRNAQIVVKTV